MAHQASKTLLLVLFGLVFSHPPAYWVFGVQLRLWSAGAAVCLQAPEFDRLFLLDALLPGS